MKLIVRILVLVLVSLFFGVAFTCIEPYPKHSSLIWVVASLLFMFVEIAQRTTHSRIAWNIYGLAIFGCGMLLNWWYWWGVKENGWWFPPQLPIVQHLYDVRPASVYDADVGNFFLVLWFVITVLFVVLRVRLFSKGQRIQSFP